MAIVKTSDGTKVELEGPSEHFMFDGVKDSDLILGYLDSKKQLREE